jgi:hypothetical protein
LKTGAEFEHMDELGIFFIVFYQTTALVNVRCDKTEKTKG